MRLRHQLLAIAAISAAAIPAVQSSAIAHQVQTDYILSDPANSITNPQTSQASQTRTGASIELQTKFANGEPLKGASVVIYAPNQPGHVWAKGTTDTQGRYNFTPNPTIQGDWEVKIKREGHADILTVPVSSNGIEADLMSQNGASDVHYAQTSPWAVVGSIAVAVACVGFARVGRKRMAE